MIGQMHVLKTIKHMDQNKIKTFIYDDKEYVVVMEHECASSSIKNLITSDQDLDQSILFCEDYHPWFNTTCQFKAILKSLFDPQMGLEYYANRIDDLVCGSDDWSSIILNW